MGETKHHCESSILETADTDTDEILAKTQTARMTRYLNDQNDSDTYVSNTDLMCQNCEVAICYKMVDVNVSFHWSVYICLCHFDGTAKTVN